MWRTQAGERILQGAEARLIRTALGVLVDQIEEEIQGFRDRLDFGVPLFDRLEGRQKLALIADVGHHLLRSTNPPPQLTATNESAVAVLYKVVDEWVSMEVDDEDELSGEDPLHWRRRLLDAYRESFPDDAETPAESSRDLMEWSLLIECLADRVLWDADFLDEHLYADQPPDEARFLKDQMGVPDEYFSAVAPDPAERELDAIRKQIRELIDV